MSTKETGVSSAGYAYLRKCEAFLEENDVGVRVYKNGRAMDLTLEEVKEIADFSTFCRERGKHRDPK